MRVVLASLLSFVRQIPALVRILLLHTRDLWLTRLTPARRWLVAGMSAVVLLALAGGVLAFTFRPTPPPPPVAQIALRTPINTLPGTATATTRPTLPPTHPPVTVPTAVPTTPPPPPVPTQPPVTPTVTFCPTATPVPPTPTATPVPPTATATTAISTATATTAGSPGTGTAPQTLTLNSAASTCTPCPYYIGNNPSQSAIRAALYAAADQYHLPRNLLLAVAWQESKWHEDVYSCDGGIGLMQVQYYTWPWLNGVSEPNCGLPATSYDPTTLSGNAGLGAKYLAYLSCFYGYDGGFGGTPSQPAKYTMAWYYQQAGLNFPDSTNPNGSPNPNSLCASVFNNANNAQYPDLPSTTAQTWSCPYSATAGDSTLLDITLSAYNEGPGTTDTCGICNPWYVASVETFIPEFFAGTLPVPS